VSTGKREQSVREFRIETNPSSERRETLLFWAALLSPLAVLSVFILSLSLKGYIAFRWLWLLTLLGTWIGGHIVAFRLRIKGARRRMVFALGDKEIIRKRSGWPDDRIAFSEIEALYERRGGLVVESAEPLKRISIPREVNGFDAIRAELVKHHSLSVQPKPLRSKPSWTRLVVMIVSILSWAVVIFIFYKVMRPR